MKRVNIFNDVESRRQIASISSHLPVSVPAIVVELINTEEDGKTEEVQGGENNTPIKSESDQTTKRGRKAARNAQKV